MVRRRVGLLATIRTSASEEPNPPGEGCREINLGRWRVWSFVATHPLVRTFGEVVEDWLGVGGNRESPTQTRSIGVCPVRNDLLLPGRSNSHRHRGAMVDPGLMVRRRQIGAGCLL